MLVGLLLAVPELLLGFFQTEPEVLMLAKTYCMIRWGESVQLISTCRINGLAMRIVSRVLSGRDRCSVQ